MVMVGIARAAAEQALIPGGAALAGYAARMHPEATVPLFDGVACGVNLAEMLGGFASGLPLHHAMPLMSGFRVEALPVWFCSPSGTAA